MRTTHDVDELLSSLAPLNRAKLLHALRCAECQDELFTALLEPPPTRFPKATSDDPLRIRATALDDWLEPQSPPSGRVEIPLLLAVAHFQMAGNFAEAAATSALLGLYCTDISPEVAQKCFRSALLHSQTLPTWLWAYSYASYELCLAQLGLTAPDLPLSLPSSMAPEEWLRFAWIRVRARVASSISLTDSEFAEHERTLVSLLSMFAGSGSIEEAILVATDLARLYSSRHRLEAIEPLARTLSDLAQHIEPVDPHVRTALETFSTLQGSPSVAAAAAPIYSLIPSIHRYASLSLLLTASEPLARTPDLTVDLKAIRAFLAPRALEASLPDKPFNI